MIVKKSALSKGLPKRTQSLCPECGSIVAAEIYAEGTRVMIRKECPEHGKVVDVYWSDKELYLKAEKWAVDGVGVENPTIEVKDGCPFDCGLCAIHTSHTNLANLDLTNRCNMNCPICFANANQAGYVYEPSFEQVARMLKVLRDERPVPCQAVQFAGGEPTIYPRFFEAIAEAKRLGFPQIQIATNGIKLTEPGFTQRMVNSGLHTVYLQFDGLNEDDYVRARGRKLLDVKMSAIESCRHTKPKPLPVVLVPTVVKGLNNDQVGAILDFAVENLDVIRSVNYQPVSFTGRITQEEREAGRYTLPDLVNDLVEQTGYMQKGDFYPVPTVVPISYLVSVLSGQPKMAFTSHPHCGLATFIFVDEGRPIPVNRFIDVDGMLTRMMELGDKASGTLTQIALRVGSRFKTQEGKRKALIDNFNKYFGEYIDADKMPGGLDIPELLGTLLSEGNKESVGQFTWKTLMVGGMHFQDGYNYDIERVKRCVVHYVTPDDRIIPFCAYNGGPTYRTEVERKFSVPLDEWKERNRGGSA